MPRFLAAAAASPALNGASRVSSDRATSRTRKWWFLAFSFAIGDGCTPKRDRSLWPEPWNISWRLFFKWGMSAGVSSIGIHAQTAGRWRSNSTECDSWPARQWAGKTPPSVWWGTNNGDQSTCREYMNRFTLIIHICKCKRDAENVSDRAGLLARGVVRSVFEEICCSGVQCFSDVVMETGICGPVLMWASRASFTCPDPKHTLTC